MTVRLLPPGTTGVIFTTPGAPGGPSIAGVLGQTQDVPEATARSLVTQGWIVLGMVGPTGARPRAAAGFPSDLTNCFIDTTLNKPCWLDGGGTYRDWTGAAV